MVPGARGDAREHRGADVSAPELTQQQRQKVEAFGLNRPTGAELIAAERDRQVTEEGYSAEHDAGHDYALTEAAKAYVDSAQKSRWSTVLMEFSHARRLGWPWPRKYWKPTGDPVRDLTKAGALIAAAIDALQAKAPES